MIGMDKQEVYRWPICLLTFFLISVIFNDTGLIVAQYGNDEMVLIYMINSLHLSRPS